MSINIHPIKLGVDHCYVVQGDGTFLIDGGSPSQSDKFLKAMGRLSIAPQNIRLIVLTHGHWDHVGSTSHCREATKRKHN